jgi:aromatic-L-amino-acid decarboxylase
LDADHPENGVLIPCVSTGYEPVMVVATVGTTSATAVDPVEQIAAICVRRSLYLYVDAAYGGAFAALPEFAWIRRGWEQADAICINLHKQLLAPLGCSLLYLKDREEVRAACFHGGAYIPDPVGPEGDPMDYTFYCGMPLNSLAPVFNLLTYGAEGIRNHLRRTVELARYFAEHLEHDPAFEIVMPYHFSTICFRVAPSLLTEVRSVNSLNAWVCEHVSKRGHVFISRTKLSDRVVLRLTVGNIYTAHTHIETAYRALRDAAVTAGRLFSFRILTAARPRIPPDADPPLGTSAWDRLPAQVVAAG